MTNYEGAGYASYNGMMNTGNSIKSYQEGLNFGLTPQWLAAAGAVFSDNLSICEQLPAEQRGACVGDAIIQANKMALSAANEPSYVHHYVNGLGDNPMNQGQL